MKPKIAIIGRGHVGKALEAGCKRAGVETKMAGKGGGAKEAAAWAEVVIMAAPFGALDAVVSEIGATLSGKVVVDATNALTAQGQLAFGARERRKTRPSPCSWPATMRRRSRRCCNWAATSGSIPSTRAGWPTRAPSSRWPS